MIRAEQTFDCKNCGATVIVEFGTYTGGPLAYDYYAKCGNCRQEYNDAPEIERLVTAKELLVGTGSISEASIPEPCGITASPTG